MYEIRKLRNYESDRWYFVKNEKLIIENERLLKRHPERSGTKRSGVKRSRRIPLLVQIAGGSFDSAEPVLSLSKCSAQDDVLIRTTL